jgi:hypothetical protein
MKKRISLLILSLAVVGIVVAQQLALNKPAVNFTVAAPVFKWTVQEYDFGKIKRGVPVTYVFKFTNTGEVPLIISTVQASCGCTVTEYTKQPIEAGQQGFVKATYNAANAGQFTKTVTVNANTEEGIARLTIKGEVVAQAE